MSNRAPKGFLRADVPTPYAKRLKALSAAIHLLRVHRGEDSRPPGIGRVAAALGHLHGWPTYPTHEDDRRLLEDLLTVLEQDPPRAHEVPELRRRMVAHYLHAGGALDARA